MRLAIAFLETNHNHLFSPLVHQLQNETVGQDQWFSDLFGRQSTDKSLWNAIEYKAIYLLPVYEPKTILLKENLASQYKIITMAT